MITIIDQIGRVVIGKKVSETDTQLTLNNPVIVYVNPNQETGQIQVQSFPYIFVEFLDKDNRDKNNWTFTKSSIVISDVVLDSAIINQYNNINSVRPQPPAGEPEVIKLFSDDE
jgi:hypothetical protein